MVWNLGKGKVFYFRPGPATVPDLQGITNRVEDRRERRPLAGAG